MICTIHQPNFLPWMPYFEKMALSDVFIMLSHCQFEKNGYQNRAMINREWRTMSVRHGLEAIHAKEYINPKEDWDTIVSALPEYADILNNLSEHITHSLLFTNTAIINALRARLNISKTIIQSDFETTKTGSARLLEICQQMNCDVYLSGPSGRHYLDLDLFEKAGIEVRFFEAQDSRSVLEALCQ